MRGGRIALGALGAALAAYGLWLLVGLGPQELAAVLTWVVGGVLAHDGVIAPLAVVLGVAAAVRSPGWLRTPLLWTLVVLGPLTIVAVPMLGRFGAKPDNPTLLDRPYWLGYTLIVALTVGAAAVAASVLRARRPAQHDA